MGVATLWPRNADTRTGTQKGSILNFPVQLTIIIINTAKIVSNVQHSNMTKNIRGNAILIRTIRVVQIPFCLSSMHALGLHRSQVTKILTTVTARRLPRSVFHLPII
jgi:hypothetical protein